MSSDINKDPLNTQMDITAIPKSIRQWLDEAEIDTKITEDNYIEKQMEQGNICLKYVRYKYKYSVLLSDAKLSLDHHIAKRFNDMDKSHRAMDDKHKLRIIQSEDEFMVLSKKIANLQAIYDTISDTLKVAERIGYAVNNIISENSYKLKLERGI